MGGEVERSDLQPECTRCFALCCVALRIPRSPGFAIEKPAGTPCPNLADDLRCTIHAELDERGFSGCVEYDCQGAGQKVSQITFGGRDWRTDPKIARWMLVVYPVVRQLHAILAAVATAADVVADAGLREQLRAAGDRVEALTLLPPEELVHVDVAAQREAVRLLLEDAAAE
jgi:hypothetical protein